MPVWRLPTKRSDAVAAPSAAYRDRFRQVRHGAAEEFQAGDRLVGFWRAPALHHDLPVRVNRTVFLIRLLQVPAAGKEYAGTRRAGFLGIRVRSRLLRQFLFICSSRKGGSRNLRDVCRHWARGLNSGGGNRQLLLRIRPIGREHLHADNDGDEQDNPSKEACRLLPSTRHRLPSDGRSEDVYAAIILAIPAWHNTLGWRCRRASSGWSGMELQIQCDRGSCGRCERKGDR